ncbi:MAG: nucleotidyltransferase domain-containing protein [Alphaproteobacteria bacterium]|jgi:predicted nucleotidyltransferase|nr:nucleotidyltransferase domain-containing protein [Alphaproteobacteria bacterium]
MPSSATAENFGLSAQMLRYLRNLPTLFDGLEKVAIFGSRAKGTHHPGSDIDLALYGPGLESRRVREIEAYLEGLPEPYLWDVVHYDALTHAGLRAHIDRVGRPV